MLVGLHHFRVVVFWALIGDAGGFAHLLAVLHACKRYVVEGELPTETDRKT
jgi:hypothetical protein